MNAHGPAVDVTAPDLPGQAPEGPESHMTPDHDRDSASRRAAMSTTEQAPKSAPDMEAVKKLTEAIDHAARAYGVPLRVSTHWAVGYGPDGAYVELYDDEEDAREHVQFYEGGFVARRTVVSLPWETVPGGGPTP